MYYLKGFPIGPCLMSLLFRGSSRDSDRQHSALKHLKEKISKYLQKVVIFCVGHHAERDRKMHLVVWQQYPAAWSKSCSASKGECFWAILVLFFSFSSFISLGSSVFFSHSAAASPFLYNFLTYPIFSASIQLKLFSSFPPGYLEPDFTREATETRTPAMPKRHEQWWTQEYAPKQAATCPYIQDRALTQEATRIRLNPEHIQQTETVHSNNSCTIKFIVFKNLTACSNWKKFL